MMQVIGSTATLEESGMIIDEIMAGNPVRFDVLYKGKAMCDALEAFGIPFHADMHVSRNESFVIVQRWNPQATDNEAVTESDK